jgi:uncharacterized protein YcfJ
MSTKSVFCISASRKQADRIIEQLKYANFPNDAISTLLADSKACEDFADARQIKALDGAVNGAAAGAIIGGALGWIAGIGVLAIPGIGPFIAAGPIVAALNGTVLGAAIGGIAGGLTGMGVPEIEAKRIEGRIQEGNILIAFHSDKSGAIERVKRIFKYAGAENIYTTSESSRPGYEDSAFSDYSSSSQEATLGDDGWIFADRLR